MLSARQLLYLLNCEEKFDIHCRYWEKSYRGGYYFVLQTQCSYGDTDGLEFALDGRMYELDYQLVDGDVELPEYALSGTDMTSQGD